MAITGGFGTTMDLERGTARQWAMGRDGVKRWADTNEPVEPPKCPYCTSDNDAVRETYFDQACAGCVTRMTHNALAQADAACGVSPGAIGSAAD